MLIRSLGLLTTVAGAALLAGCATVSSQHIGRGEALDTHLDPYCDAAEGPKPEGCRTRTPEEMAKPGVAGITYFLPRQLARVTATRTGGKLDDSVKALLKAQLEVETTQASIDAANAAIRQTEDAIIAGSGGAAGLPILNARLTAQKASVASATAALTTKTNAVERAKEDLRSASRQVAASGSDKASKVTLKIELLAPSADPAQAYVLSPHHTPFRDDEHKLVVSPAGLLTSTDIVASDRTADILVEIATFAGAIQGRALPSLMGRSDGQPKRCAGSPDEFTGIVDFADPASIARLNDDLQCLGVRAHAAGQRWPPTARPPEKPAAGVEGIVYRTPVQVQVRIEKCLDPAGACTEKDPNWYTTEVLALSLPQAGPISYVRQDAGFMTKSKYTMAFKDGILTDYSAARPSELLEVARTPMRLVNGLFDGLSKIISLRTGQNNGLAALSASELAVLNAQIALQAGQINGQRTLSAAELALLQQQFALQAGEIEGQRTLSAAELALLQQQLALQAGALEGQRTLSAAELAVLQQRFALQAGLLEGQRTLSAAELALLQQQFALQSGTLVGQTGLTNAQIALLQSQGGVAIATNNVAAQQSASNWALTLALLRDQSRQEALTRCVAQQTQANLSIDVCLAGF